jgi:hypothetical protein
MQITGRNGEQSPSGSKPFADDDHQQKDNMNNIDSDYFSAQNLPIFQDSDTYIKKT